MSDLNRFISEYREEADFINERYGIGDLDHECALSIGHIYDLMRSFAERKANGITTSQEPVLHKHVVNTRFKCKCGCNDFYFVGTIPEISTDEGTQEEDALYGCFDCGDNYYLSEINGC